MEVNWLEDFLTLSVTRNFSRAAEIRNVTQSAFSRRIQILEHWVGAALIDRSVFPIALTNAGEAFRATAQEALQMLRTGREEAQGLVPRAGEVITLCASHTLAVSFFADWHADLQRSLGVIKTRVIPDNVAGCVEGLIASSCDLMLTYSDSGVPAFPGLERFPSVLLANERMVPVSAPKANGRPLHDLESDGALPYLCYPGTSMLGKLTTTIVEREQLAERLHYRYECSMAEALKRGAVAGAGLAWIPERAVRDELASGLLVLAGSARHTASLGITLYRNHARSRLEIEQIWAHSLENASTT